MDFISQNHFCCDPVTAPTLQLTAPHLTSPTPAPLGAMQVTQLPQQIPATAFPPAITPMPQRPAGFYPPMLYWYPSPPISSPTIFTHPGPCAIVMRGLPYNVTIPDIVNYFQGFPEVGQELLRLHEKLQDAVKKNLLLRIKKKKIGGCWALVWVFLCLWGVLPYQLSAMLSLPFQLDFINPHGLGAFGVCRLSLCFGLFCSLWLTWVSPVSQLKPHYFV